MTSRCLSSRASSWRSWAHPARASRRLIGGLVGLGLAGLGVLVIGEFIGIEASVSAWIVAMALAVSVSIGVFFGVAPAWRAARMDPIAALRHE